MVCGLDELPWWSTRWTFWSEMHDPLIQVSNGCMFWFDSFLRFFCRVSFFDALFFSPLFNLHHRFTTLLFTTPRVLFSPLPVCFFHHSFLLFARHHVFHFFVARTVDDGAQRHHLGHQQTVALGQNVQNIHNYY